MLGIPAFCINVKGELLEYFATSDDPRSSPSVMSLIDEGQDVQGGSALLTALLYHNWEAVQVILDEFPKIFPEKTTQEFLEHFYKVGKIKSSWLLNYHLQPVNYKIFYRNGFTEIFFTLSGELEWTILAAEISRPKTSPKFVEFMINHGAQISEDVMHLANMKSLVIQNFLEKKKHARCSGKKYAQMRQT